MKIKKELIIMAKVFIPVAIVLAGAGYMGASLKKVSMLFAPVR